MDSSYWPNCVGVLGGCTGRARTWQRGYGWLCDTCRDWHPRMWEKMGIVLDEAD